MGDDVDNPGWEASLLEDLGVEDAASDGRLFGWLQHDRVTERKGCRDRTQREDQRRVLRREAGDDANRLADTHIEGARQISREDFADGLVDEAGDLAQTIGRVVRMELAIDEG